MVEPIMYLAIGFLVSTLLGLMIVPLVHNRAVRLTTRRLEAAAPVSRAEIQADKDQLRAEFAMAARKLEINVDKLKHQTSSQLAELGKKTDAINRLKLELAEKNAAIFALQSREAGLKQQLEATEQEFTAKAQALQSAEQALSAKQAELASLTADLSERSQTADSRERELATVHSEIDTLKTRVQDAEQEFVTTQQRLEQQRSASDLASRELTEAREHGTSLNHRVADLDRQLSTQVKQSETLASRVTQLEAENAELRAALAGKRGAAPVTTAEMEHLRADKTRAEQELKSAREERAKLQRDLVAIQQQAEAAWATERTENALLRERINEIAAEVAKLAIQLEGPNSQIETMLADAKPATAAAGDTNRTAAARPSLADRIKALQSQATRRKAS
jgi:chromosome segregation ATPase